MENIPAYYHDMETTQQSETASWILREKATKRVIVETFDPRKVAALNTTKYEAVPIHDYLIELNQAIIAA